MDDIPHHILQDIFEYAGTKGWFGLNLTCKKWNTIARQILYKVCGLYSDQCSVIRLQDIFEYAILQSMVEWCYLLYLWTSICSCSK